MTPLYLIDGHNVLYRTFYGIPRLSAPDGTPTNAILGVARILLKILKEDRPSAIVAVFDSREPTPRHDLYPEYKATRLKVPEDLASQIPLVRKSSTPGVPCPVPARRTTSSARFPGWPRRKGWRSYRLLRQGPVSLVSACGKGTA
jgi:hypothetical protein